MRILATLALAVLIGSAASAQGFDKTLRLDCIFSGDNDSASISVSKMHSIPGWAGRGVNMDSALLEGNGRISLLDGESGDTLFVNTFSTLFQEWQSTEEATTCVKAFENVFLVPMPKAKATVSIELFDSRRKVSASLSYPVDPDDILIRPFTGEPLPHEYIHYSGDPSRKIDIAVIAEGYTSDEMDLFMEDARKAVESIWTHEPFSSMKDRFNIVAVKAASKDSGVSVPRQGKWKNTVLGSHFDTFYSDRYLTTLNLFDLHDCLEGIPYEHIIILTNTDTYGGGGIYNSYVLVAAHHRFTSPVVVHEFGHSFAGLADEYYYDDQYENMYHPDIEPWEPNITTLNDGGAKWKDLLGVEGVGFYEGGGYMSKGVWRPSDDCRMKTNTYPKFCPVCEKAIRDIIDYQTVSNK
ncbi:MAG: peptidase M64 [Bacteroidales bacterium]|nr:peptidase M64 [Bacteroidales bacterium]